MSTSSNVSMRPRFMQLTKTDGTHILANLDLVYLVEEIPNGVRIYFGTDTAEITEPMVSLQERLTP